ncbi:hypothetical protein N9M16_05530 [Candidatus Dependentiae bacterium]|nr:hypothetical protein [Candidatus Dependentiae bacterium]
MCFVQLSQPISDGTGSFKAAVIHEISPIANPKFSKMSGIQVSVNSYTTSLKYPINTQLTPK